MEPRIEILPAKKLVGKRLVMSLLTNRTHELWQSFMSRRKEVGNTIGTPLYSMQWYGATYFDHFNPSTEFEKWAAIEVTNFDQVPDGMEAIALPSGLYAVFLYRGAASGGPQLFQFIFGTWLPNSEYTLDNRPHFEVLGEKYKNEDPDSEEEIWIPIKRKNILSAD